MLSGIPCMMKIFVTPGWLLTDVTELRVAWKLNS